MRPSPGRSGRDGVREYRDPRPQDHWAGAHGRDRGLAARRGAIEGGPHRNGAVSLALLLSKFSKAIILPGDVQEGLSKLVVRRILCQLAADLRLIAIVFRLDGNDARFKHPRILSAA